MSPESARIVVERMKKIAKRMREIAERADFHSNLRYKAMIVADHADQVAAECLEEIR